MLNKSVVSPLTFFPLRPLKTCSLEIHNIASVFKQFLAFTVMCCNCSTETPPSFLPNVVVVVGGGGGGGGSGGGGGDVEPTNFVDVCGSGPTRPNTFLT